MNKVLNIQSVKDTLLYKELLKRNNEQFKVFVANIPDLCEEASDRIKIIPKFFSEYTLHDKAHFLRVTELMSYVIGNNLKHLNDIEIGLLILSAFYHDQGMLIESEEFKHLEKNKDYLVFRDNWYIDHPNYHDTKNLLKSSHLSQVEISKIHKLINELDSGMLTEYLRASHGQRSHDFIISKFKNDRVLTIGGVNISDCLARICLSHVKSNDWIFNSNMLSLDDSIGLNRVNTVFLSIVLRLADILDFDSDRTPDVLYKSIFFSSPISLIEWQKHRSVRGWEISKELVQFTMYFENPVYEKAANIFLDWIDIELNGAHSLIRKFPQKFNKYKIAIAEKVDRTRLGPKNNSYIYHDLEFVLSRDEIVKLLMTDNLYLQKSILIRELLQNSLDALRLKKAIYKKDKIDWEIGKVIFRHYIDNTGEEIVECKDNGCGMDEEVVSKFLGKVGRSYYRSPEFERERIELKENGVDFNPCSQFGIGFMSCFMVGDRIEILTRKDYGVGKKLGKPLIIEINGLGGLFVLKEGFDEQESGTVVKVFSRKKPPYHGYSTDKIRMLDTLKSYALATEFPIEANCTIGEIAGILNIPTTIEKKKTFLEELEIQNISTFEVNLETIDQNLRGYLRQSFLNDNECLPSVQNSYAKWDILIDPQKSRITNKQIIALTNLQTGNNVEYGSYYPAYGEGSICIDGILVGGAFGRLEYPNVAMKRKEPIHSGINSEHPFIVDVRGDIKPELKPSREPLFSYFHSQPGWTRLQDSLDKARGILWERILRLSEDGLLPETFWKLIIIYKGRIDSVSSNILYNFLEFPIYGNSWLHLFTIKSFSIEGNKVFIEDSENRINEICFPNEILIWNEASYLGSDPEYSLRQILIHLSKLVAQGDKITFVLRNQFEFDEAPKDHYLSVPEIIGVNSIPFDNIGREYVTITKHKYIVNSKNPIVQVVAASKMVRDRDEMQEFCFSFLGAISHLIIELYNLNQPLSVEEDLGLMRHCSNLFLKINWSLYAEELKPPYKIFIDESNYFEITSDVFEKWAKR